MRTLRQSMVPIFISFAPEDTGLVQALEKHLSPLVRTGLVALWHSGKIGAGTDKRATRDADVDRAGLVLLLVSADFLANDGCIEDTQRALARAESGQAQVFAIVARPCDWNHPPLAHPRVSTLPVGGLPVTSHPNQDEAWRAIARALRDAVDPRPPRAPKDDPALEPGTRRIPRHAGPAARLNARHEVVPFHGREALVDELRRWCEDREEDGDARARLIHAPGGMGKTRLMIELCKQMHDRGWRAGFLRDSRKLAELADSDRPVLVVLDYAESRSDLREMLALVAAWHGAMALRVILLARNANDWWADVLRRDTCVKDMFSEEEVLELQAITPDRETIFRKAVKAFSGKEYEGSPPSLEHPRYERVLYIHLAALAAAQGRKVAIDALMEDTLDHEERFWQELLPDRGRVQEEKAAHKMRLAVAALSLIGGARDRAEADHITGDEDMTVLLRDLYPGRAGRRYIGALEPDLLGEAMVRRALKEEGTGAGPYLDRVFDGADGEAIRTGFTVLGRLSEDHKEAADWIARVLDRDVVGRAMEALAAAKIVGERTAYAALGLELARALEQGGTVELAKALARELPKPDETVSLHKVGRWVMGKLLDDLLDGSTDPERARVLNNLALWQSALGQHDAALISAQEAVDIRCKLAQTHPLASELELARSLHNLGKMQSALGQHEAALTSAHEAVNIRRKLAELRPDRYLPDLALNLTSLGVRQSALGKYEAARATTQEAVDIYRRLSDSLPDLFMPRLAGSVDNLGLWQSALGDRDAAVASAEEAVDIRRKLAQKRPEAFLPDLARSLGNLAHMRSDRGQLDAALAPALEAASICDKLAQGHPEAFLPDLAKSLNNVGAVQSALGQYDVALVTVNEALATIWPLFLRLPSAFEPITSRILGNLCGYLAALGRSPSVELLARIETFAHLCMGNGSSAT